MEQKDQALLSWKTLEYPYQEKDSGWFIALFIIAISGLVGAFLYGEFLFAVVIALGSFTLALYAVKKPGTVEIVITEKKVWVNDTPYPYKTLASFSIDEDATPDKLILERHILWNPLIIAPIPKEIPSDEVRALLKKKLPEKYFREPLSHRVMEYLGF